MVSYYLNFWCRAYLIKKKDDKHVNQSHPSYFTLSRTVMLGLPYFAGVIFPIQPLLPVCCSHFIDTPTLYLTFPLRSGHYILFFYFLYSYFDCKEYVLNGNGTPTLFIAAILFYQKNLFP